MQETKYVLPIPEQLIDSLLPVKGFDEQSFRDIHSSGEKLTSVRINPAKKIDAEIYFPGAEKVPWTSYGYYLKLRPSFTLDPLFHAGAYYVQEAGSMFLEEAMRQTIDLNRQLRVLDLCASPGGKSTLIQSVISSESLLVSNEVIKTRVNTLEDNMIKWGSANVVVTNNDAKDFQRLPSFFDVIIVDAPCSGSGLFRKDNDAISEWSLNNVGLCSQRQQRILADVLPALKEGGTLIYSTCSYSPAEDEDIADMLAADHGMKNKRLDIGRFPGIVETESEKHHCFGYRFYPDKIRTEGFFISVFTKQEAGGTTDSKKRSGNILVTRAEKEMIVSYFKKADVLEFIRQKDDVLAIPKELLNDLDLLRGALYIKKAGVKAGMPAHKGLIPAHDLAVSTIVSDIFPSVSPDLPVVLDYLRKKDIVLETGEKGWMLIRYADQAIGLVKILPGRVNNYYPKELRILNR